MDVEALQQDLRRFSARRGWGRHHNPKSLVMALTVEVAELVEHFQWLTEDESFRPADPEGVQEEVADVLIYLIQIADQLNIDIAEAVNRKMQRNADKYPEPVTVLRTDGGLHSLTEVCQRGPDGA
ncbi:nucleotide pyrophosphohydrolase [Deinococcus aestuarii]|uniref:nucleotide pyrophosphohydrolase n=1 Tax=Deinococcus aestuarii TaxID=2774531 RepID=UPI001C0D21B8|nr:nucleotide pyrophosphohydrolase [Deinococcus aestuarii]